MTKGLLEPIVFGDLHLKNKMIVAPLTRCRADIKTNVPNELMKTYYTQRAGFGLIIAEACSVSPLSATFTGAGHIHTEEQSAGWKNVVDGVHAAGGLIILQLWHGGRSTNTSQINGAQPVSSSPNVIQGITNIFANNEVHDVPRELSTEEVKEVVGQFRRAAELAKQAGFDGVQLHSANGYLVDQFLQDSTNQRTDKYGGSIENRSRFALEIIDALIEVYGAGRVSVRFSPTGRYNDMYESQPLALMSYVFSELEKKNIAFIELRRWGKYDLQPQFNQGERISSDKQIPDFFVDLRKLYNGNIVGNDTITLEEGESLLGAKTVQAIAFGQLTIRNPNLPQQYEKDLPIDYQRDYKTYYFNSSAEGYTIHADLSKPQHAS